MQPLSDDIHRIALPVKQMGALEIQITSQISYMWYDSVYNIYHTQYCAKWSYIAVWEQDFRHYTGNWMATAFTSTKIELCHYHQSTSAHCMSQCETSKCTAVQMQQSAVYLHLWKCKDISSIMLCELNNLLFCFLKWPSLDFFNDFVSKENSDMYMQVLTDVAPSPLMESCCIVWNLKEVIRRRCIVPMDWWWTDWCTDW